MSKRQRENVDEGDDGISVKNDRDSKKMNRWKSLNKMKEYLQSEFEKKNWHEDKRGTTYIHFAAYLGDIDAMKMLIEDNADVNRVDRVKGTALHLAARKGHVDVVKVLIENGADVNAVDEDKWTALHNAAQFGRVDIVKVLIRSGADVNAVNGNSWTALGIALYQGTALGIELYHADLRHIRCALQLLCLGAEIDERTIGLDVNDFIEPIENRLKLLRNGNRIGTSLMSDEERHFMWNLAFSFTIQHRVAAFKAYYAIRSFITFHGIFMASGYELGED
eukprot:g1506.t1